MDHPNKYRLISHAISFIRRFGAQIAKSHLQILVGTVEYSKILSDRKQNVKRMLKNPTPYTYSID